MNSGSVFDQRAASWDQDQRRKALVEAVLSALFRAVRFEADSKVLELGAGTGLVTMGLAQAAGHVTAMDNSEGMLEVLRNKLTQASGTGQVTPVCADAEAEWPVSGPFDVIAGSMMLHHVRDTQRLLEQAWRRLVPGGVLALVDADKEPGDFHDDNTSVHHFGFERDALAYLLESVGFNQVMFFPVTVMTKPRGDRIAEYPIFLVTATKAR